MPRSVVSLAIIMISAILISGWNVETFTHRVLSFFVDDRISIDQGITELESYPNPYSVLWKGDIENRELSESSGLTSSTRERGVLWSMNDSGSAPEIFALSESGAHLGKWKVEGIISTDWEGMDSFQLDDRHFLLIADTGDNFHRREEVSFIVIEEPKLSSFDETILVSWQTRFRFPDGPKDVEAVAVDIKAKQVIFLNKRELPLRLYGVPLLPTAERITASKIGKLVPIPRYRFDLEELYGGGARYLGLPTGMDLFENKLLVTTYRNAYLYEFDSLQKPPKEISLPYFGQREAITFGFDNGEIAFVSRERNRGTEVADIFEIYLSP